MKRRTKKEKNSLSSELPELCIPLVVCAAPPSSCSQEWLWRASSCCQAERRFVTHQKNSSPLTQTLHLLAVASSSVHTYSAFFPQTGYTRKAKAALKGQDRSNSTWMQTTPEICCILLSCQGSGALRLLAGSSQSSVRMDGFCILLSLGGKYVVPQELHQFWKLL